MDDLKTISVLGSTGSIGVQTLEVISLLGMRVKAFVAGTNIKLLEEQARQFKPEMVAVHDEEAASLLKAALADTDIKVLSGDAGIIEAAAAGADVVVASITGMAGILPTLAAIDAGSDIALANKEALVCAGEIIMKRAEDKGVKILPVDSEHSAIFQCLQDKASASSLEKILLTASGGPFFGKRYDELRNVMASDALKHPNWSMGKKVTVDSATLMNKGLELIEAMRLYGVSSKEIQILIHRESIVHSMVQFADGSILAQMSMPDMKLPIQYAITYPNRVYSTVKKLDLAEISKLTFFNPDRIAFPCLAIAESVADRGQALCTAMNAANEAAVDLFLRDKIGFNDIPEIINNVLSSKSFDTEISDIKQIMEIGDDAFKMAYYVESCKHR